MLAICKQPLIFMITHRLSNIRATDQVLVIKNGQIIERGNQSSRFSSRRCQTES